MSKPTSKRILIALTSHDRKGDTGQPTGAYLPELAHPHAIFVAAGHRVEFVSVRGGAVPLDGVNDPDPVSAAFLADAALVARLHASPASAAVRAADYDAVFFAGGHGTMWDFADDPGLQRLAAEIYEAGGVVGAVCHGPAALVNVRLASGEYLVAGKEVSAFTNEEERAIRLDRVVPFLLADRLAAAGARLAAGPMWQSKVSVSGRLVTGQNPASAVGVAEAMVDLLGSLDHADAPRPTRAAGLLAAVLLALAPAAACGDDGAADDDAGTTTVAAGTTSGDATDASTSDAPTTAADDDATTAGESGGTSGGEADAPVVLPGFDMPESVHWSAEERAWFVSNIGVEIGAKDGNGFISRLDADGGVVAMDWVTGLDGPAGLRAAGGTLYVADIDRLHAIDIASATLTRTVTVAGAMFLNDVAIGPGGQVFVSDTVTHSVHAWTPGEEPVLVIQSPGLEAPNGLAFKGDVLHVAGIGSLSDGSLLGRLQRVEMGVATPLSDLRGKFDGLEVDGDGFLATEFTGKLERIAGDGATVTLVRDLAAEDGFQSTADLGFDPDRRIVALPDLLGGQVALLRLPDAG